jgi:hypothetical protein
VADGQEQSKRQRQKERRAAKRAQQQRQAAAAKRRRTFATIGIVVLVLAGIGVLVAGQVQGWLDRRATVAASEDRLADFGCTPIEEMPHLGAGHFGGQADELAAAPPEAIYDHRPTTSGQHLGLVAVTGVYDDYVDERLTTHNLEHGYVVMWWDPELADGEVEELKSWASEKIDGGYDHLIAAPYNEPLPDGGKIAFTSWDHRQLCDEFDPQVAEAFLIERHNSPDVPEAGAGPHHGERDGELDPATDAVVFPPFSDAVPGAPAMEDTDAENADG